MSKVVKKKRGPPPGILRAEPIYPEKTLAVVRMRESGMTYAEIAAVTGGTRMNACHVYRRWRAWGLRELAAGRPPPSGSTPGSSSRRRPAISAAAVA